MTIELTFQNMFFQKMSWERGEVHVEIPKKRLTTQFDPYIDYNADFWKYPPCLSWGRGEVHVKFLKSQLALQFTPYNDNRADVSVYLPCVLRTRRGAVVCCLASHTCVVLRRRRALTWVSRPGGKTWKWVQQQVQYNTPAAIQWCV